MSIYRITISKNIFNLEICDVPKEDTIKVFLFINFQKLELSNSYLVFINL